jgi:hypothetical protein
MWTHVSLNLDIVWEDVLWRALAIWQEDEHSEPVVLEKGGRVPLPADGGPDEALYAAVRALQGQPLQEH